MAHLHLHSTWPFCKVYWPLLLFSWLLGCFPESSPALAGRLGKVVQTCGSLGAKVGRRSVSYPKWPVHQKQAVIQTSNKDRAKNWESKSRNWSVEWARQRQDLIHSLQARGWPLLIKGPRTEWIIWLCYYSHLCLSFLLCAPVKSVIFNIWY